MTDKLDWFAQLPEPVRAALLADPGTELPPRLIARLPRLYRATYGVDDPATGCWSLRPEYAQALRDENRPRRLRGRFCRQARG